MIRRTRFPLDSLLDRLERLLDSVIVRAILSLLILSSVLPRTIYGALLPPELAQRMGMVFLFVFVPEFVARLLLFERRRREERLKGFELFVLCLDFLAVITFLPVVEQSGIPALRQLRLVRLLLLLGYWRSLFRDLWAIVSQRERRDQVALVLVLGGALALFATVFLLELAPNYDFNGDGKRDNADRDFVGVLWWSFRQVQDPGNLVQELDNLMVVVVSLGLTFSGLLLFSFFIGIGTSVVEELVMRSRSQRLGYFGHTVILGMTAESPLLFHGLAEIYRKNLRSLRAAVLIPEPGEHPCFNDSRLRHFRSRFGHPVQTSDLDLVSVDRAKRIIVLGPRGGDPDAEVISAILATRRRNPQVDLYADLEHERNFRAAKSAGGPGTHVVGSGSLFGYYLAQNVVHPGIYRLIRSLLASSGCEIYTYIFSPEERQQLMRRDTDGGLLFDTLYPWVLEEFQVNLLGFFIAQDAQADLTEDELEFFINPVVRAREQGLQVFDAEGRMRWETVRGLIGIGGRFKDITRLARFLVDPSRPLSHGAPKARPGSLGELRLLPSFHPVRKVLICGASPRIPRVVTELVAHYRSLEVTVLARRGESFGSLAQDLRKMLAQVWGVGSSLEGDEGGILRLRFEAEGLTARVAFSSADWSHSEHLEELGLLTVQQADAILLLPAATEDINTDGTIALDCLHLANLEKSGEEGFRENLHVLALVRDPVKGDLLESRLTEMGRESGVTTRYTVVSRERSRHLFLMQCVFVRGLNAIYLGLLRFKGQHLSRLEPVARPKAEEFNPWELSQHLLFQRGLVLIGYEKIGAAGSHEVIVSPEELLGDKRVSWSAIKALYVLGSGDDLAAAGRIWIA